MPLFESKTLKPVIDRDYNWTQAVEAHKYMESNSNMGKIILNGIDKLWTGSNRLVMNNIVNISHHYPYLAYLAYWHDPN